MRCDWSVKRLGELCDITSSKRIYANEYRSFGVPFYRGKEIIEKQKGNQISTELFIAQSRYDDISYRFGVPQAGDILLTSVGTLGVPYLVKPLEVFYFKDGNLTWFRNFVNTDSRFIYYWLLSPHGRNQIDTKSIGSTQKALTIETLQKFNISLPSFREQRAIAATLSCLDDKIELNNRMNKTLEEMAQAIFKSWFVDFEPFQDGEFVDSELGRIPKGWRVGTLGEFFPIITGKKNANIASDKGTYPFFSCSQTISYTDDYSFDANAILVAGNGDFNVKSYNGKFEAYQRTYVLIPYDKLLVGFLYYAMKYFLNDITSGYRGSVIKFITKSNLQDYKLALPPSFSNIEAITTMQSILSSIAEIERQTQMFVKIRDFILPKLMSGEIRIPMEV